MADDASWVWIDPAAVMAVHEEQPAEHGGGTGVRDAGGLESALARPQQPARHGQPDAADLAAKRAFGLARSHPFVDGNKRTAFVAAEPFLALNGCEPVADDADCVVIMPALATGEPTEGALAARVRHESRPR